MRGIVLYRTDAGRCPVEEFLGELDDRHARKVLWVMRLVEQLETVPAQYFKKLAGTDDLWEIRAQFGGMSYRLLGFFDGPALVVLTSGFAKKRQEVPVQEIGLAHERRKEYLKRKVTR